MIDLQTYRFQIGINNNRICKVGNRNLRFNRMFCFDVQKLWLMSENKFLIYIVFYLFLIIYLTSISLTIILLCPNHSLSPPTKQSLFKYPRCDFWFSSQLASWLKVFSAILCYQIIKLYIGKSFYLNFTGDSCHGMKKLFEANIGIRKRSFRFLIYVCIWIFSINFFSIAIVNPSMLNPGPRESISVVYQNIQGL